MLPCLCSPLALANWACCQEESNQSHIPPESARWRFTGTSMGEPIWARSRSCTTAGLTRCTLHCTCTPCPQQVPLKTFRPLVAENLKPQRRRHHGQVAPGEVHSPPIGVQTGLPGQSRRACRFGGACGVLIVHAAATRDRVQPAVTAPPRQCHSYSLHPRSRGHSSQWGFYFFAAQQRWRCQSIGLAAQKAAWCPSHTTIAQ